MVDSYQGRAGPGSNASKHRWRSGDGDINLVPGNQSRLQGSQPSLAGRPDKSIPRRESSICKGCEEKRTFKELQDTECGGQDKTQR